MGQGDQDRRDRPPVKTLKILSGGAAHGVVEKARAEFEKTSGCTIDGTFSAAKKGAQTSAPPRKAKAPRS